ncbi:unnamed protein product [Dicrocoelium dendriticum]|nr:unnamed protein product [Dicrocoelium dendriticum]
MPCVVLAFDRPASHKAPGRMPGPHYRLFQPDVTKPRGATKVAPKPDEVLVAVGLVCALGTGSSVGSEAALMAKESRLDGGGQGGGGRWMPWTQQRRERHNSFHRTQNTGIYKRVHTSPQTDGCVLLEEDGHGGPVDTSEKGGGGEPTGGNNTE